MDYGRRILRKGTRVTIKIRKIMKAESMKHLQKMHTMCSEDMGYFKELIEAIIRIESEPKTKSKLKIWDYVSDDDLRPAMCCVMHDSGFKVASDSHILIALREDYEPELEGKLMKKNGTFEDKYTKYPKWRDVIPDPQRMGMVPVKMDFDKVRGFESDFKARIKAAGLSPKYTFGSVKVNNSWFKLDMLMKAVKFMEHIGADTLYVAPDGRRAGLAVSGDSKCVVMPMYVSPDAQNEYSYVMYE